jgi:iron transport multicopper oxidase
MNIFDFLCHIISYRFRLVSISCDPYFTFSIDGHNLTVIEVEGTNTQPLLIDSLDIFAGASVNYSKLPAVTN